MPSSGALPRTLRVIEPAAPDPAGVAPRAPGATVPHAVDIGAIRAALAEPRSVREGSPTRDVGCGYEPSVPGAAEARSPGTASALEPGVPPLSTYYVYLTGGCNLACQHCWVTPSLMRNEGTGGHVPADRLLETFRSTLPLGLSSVKLTGGEPLLHPEFVQLARGIERLGLQLWMESNLTLLTPEKATAIRDCMSFFSTSLDAPTEAEHDSFRGIPGSFRATCEAVRLLAPYVHVQVIMSVHGGNADGIEDLLALARRLGARSVKFNLIHSMGRADRMRRSGRTLDVRELIRLGRLVENEWGPRHGIATHWSWPLAFQSLRDLLGAQRGTCGIHGILGILASGHYALCGVGRATPDLVYGSLDDDIVEIWNRHATLRRLRDELPEKLEGVCGSCLLKRSCKAHCVASNYHEGASLTRPFWFCDEAHREGLFPASRLVAPLPRA